ncbi:MAG TPA: hypothetical protein VKZ42_06930 [Flavobacteriaceae bacterium]|nr:hypothetical protein [Flavobacteriaceae bacterium]
MKTILFCLFLSLQALSQDLDSVRSLYKKAAESKENTEKFYQYMSGFTEESATIRAYKAAAIALNAKFAEKINDKKELFTQGVALLEKEILENPNNVEIRLIRLSIQQNSPKILKYKDRIETDKEFILRHFPSQSEEVKNYVLDYARNTDGFTPSEKQKLGI